MGHFVYYFQKCDVGFYDDCKYKIAAGLSKAGEILAIVVLKTFTHLETTGLTVILVLPLVTQSDRWWDMYICLTEKSSLKSPITLTGHRSDHEKLFLVSFTLLAIRYLLVNILSLVQTNSPASASSLHWTMKRRCAGSEWSLC